MDKNYRISGFVNKVALILAVVFGLGAALMIIISLFGLVSSLFEYLAYNAFYIVIILTIALVIAFLFTEWFDKVLIPINQLNKSLISIVSFIILGIIVFKVEPFRVYSDGLYCASVSFYQNGEEDEAMRMVEVIDGYVEKVYFNIGNNLYMREVEDFKGALDSDGFSSFYMDDIEYVIFLESKDIPCVR